MNRETVNMVRSPISVEGNIRLVPYYPAYDTALAWYQDAQLCKQVDNRDFVYDLPLLKRMYHYLDTHGGLFYIEYRGVLCGDVSLRTTGELAIVICRSTRINTSGGRSSKKCWSWLGKGVWRSASRTSIPSIPSRRKCLNPLASSHRTKNAISTNCKKENRP